MLRLFLCCVLVFFQVHSRCHAQTAYLESYRVYEGDIAMLVIEYDSKIPSLYALDTSKLEIDFVVLDIKSRISQVVESNDAFHRMQWKIEILPRHSGSLRIPPMIVGELSTPQLTLEVLPQSPELRSAQNIFIEVQAQPQNPYVGQLTQVTMRVLHNMPLSDFRLYEPATENVDVYRHGKDVSYVTIRDGTRFNVLERRIALVAREPGKISLSPASYRGLINSDADTSGAITPVRKRRIYRNSEALQLQIRKPPSVFSGDIWLPAIQFEVSQHWDEIADELRVGDSPGLTLTIESRGLPAAALPAGLISVDSEQFKIYTDQEIRSNRYEDNELVGRLEQRFAVVVSQPGEIEIPSTLLKWWDLTRDVEKVVRLEGKKLIVINPALSQSSNAGPGQAPFNLLSEEEFGLASVRTHWHRFVLIGLILLICGAWFGRKSVRDRVHRRLGIISATRQNRKNLKQACISNDPARTRQALLQWGRGQWPDDNITGLQQIGLRMKSPTLSKELAHLDAVLYSSHAATWQGRSLWQSIIAEQSYPAAISDPHEKSLPDLYPLQDSCVQSITR
jgi:hypothetical protein